MRIVVTGGGSGGHITPILAVASELKKRHPKAQIIYIGQRGDQLTDLPANHAAIDRVYAIYAGKFRRYHGEGWKQLFDLPTVLKNVRDACYVLLGTIQSWVLLRRIKPNVVFTRGGYVSVPVAVAAKLRHISYITHDSDALPSLANRLIAPWAAVHAVALPKETYPYDQDKTITTGIPLSDEFRPIDETMRQTYRQHIGIASDIPLLLICGGGLGSRNLNTALQSVAGRLFAAVPKLYIVHVVGREHAAAVQRDYLGDQQLSEAQKQRVRVIGYTTELHCYSGAATAIVTRAGATVLAEFAVQGKPIIIVPSPFLTGGHQLKNAQVLVDREAARLINEDQLTNDQDELVKTVTDLLVDAKEQSKLAHNLSMLAEPNGAANIVNIIEHYI